MIADVGSVQIGFDDVGTGMPVVFIHGFPHDRTLWSGQVAALSTHVRCLSVDVRGFGESSQIGPFSVDQFADDIAGLMDALDVQRAVICGLSMGGYVAMSMWRRHADRVLALVLADTKAGADTDEGKQKRDELVKVAEREGSGAIAASQLTGMLGKTTRAKRPEIVVQTQQMMERVSVAGIVGALTAMRDRPDAGPTLESVTVPVLVLVGDEDVLTPVREANGILSMLKNSTAAKLEVIEGAGHLSCVERPAAVTHALADFLAACSVHS